LFVRAVVDGLIAAGASPAHPIAKPRRLPCARRALSPRELAEINDVARTSGNDAVLDALLLRLHTETACRRGGVLALHRSDLDPDQGLVRLREMGGDAALAADQPQPGRPPGRPRRGPRRPRSHRPGVGTGCSTGPSSGWSR
jgi:integrase